LSGDNPAPARHQVVESPEFKPPVDAYQLRQLALTAVK
jgi:hypothetical protein